MNTIVKRQRLTYYVYDWWYTLLAVFKSARNVSDFIGRAPSAWVKNINKRKMTGHFMVKTHLVENLMIDKNTITVCCSNEKPPERISPLFSGWIDKSTMFILFKYTGNYSAILPENGEKENTFEYRIEL